MPKITNVERYCQPSMDAMRIVVIACVAVASNWKLCSSLQVKTTFTFRNHFGGTFHQSRIKTIDESFRHDVISNTKLFVTAQDEDELIAAVEDGSIDIETLEEMMGESFEVGDYDEDELYDDESEEYLDNSDDNDERSDDDEDEVDEEELILQFIRHIRETNVGDLDVEDSELIREILRNFPVDDGSIVYDDNDEKKASHVVDYLLHRFIEEWKHALELLKDDDEQNNEKSNAEIRERERLFRPMSRDFFNTMVAISKDDQNNESADVKASRMWNLLTEQLDLISFFENEDENEAAESLHPTAKEFELILSALLSSSDRGVDRKASTIVEEWLPRYGLFPTPGIYGPYIQMAAKARHRGAARKAELILRKAVQEYPPNDYESPLGVEVFNAVVTAYAKARGESYGPERAQELIVFMDSLGKPGCAPNAKTFTSLVDAYAQTNDWDSVFEAQQILNNLLNQYLLQEGDGKYLEPSVATWTIVIAAWMRLSRKGRTGAAKRAGDLLRRMESLSSSGKISAKPDAITYVTVFNAYASSKFQDEVEKAEELLDEMNEMYLDGDDSFKPSVKSIKSLLEAWIKVDEIKRAETTLARYEDILVEAEENNDDTIRHSMSADDWKDIYKLFLTGHARLGNPKRATSYLNLMIENEDMEPDSICYEKIIESYTRFEQIDLGKKTQEIFQLLEKRRLAGAITPNERVFTCFIRALVKAKVSGLHKKADLVLQRMHSLSESGNADAEPTIFTYNAVLNACAECVDIDSVSNEEAFQTSVRLFTELRKRMDPDHVTYANTIRCANLLSSDSQQEMKDKFITATFNLCCEAGRVNNYLIRDLGRSASDDVWKSLTGFAPELKEEAATDPEKAAILLEQLPIAWGRQMSQKPSQKGRKQVAE